ncbi:PilZ domain-containing protein [Vibrio sp. FNV 38]|nr:PilZ domain-containing protein [Vibrio sp. FNV 38]
MLTVTAPTNVEQKRRHFRLRYPQRARPVIRLQGQGYYVSELSERGIRVEMRYPESYLFGSPIAGHVALKGAEVIKVEGHVLRSDHNQLVVELVTGPSFKQMMQQQGYVRKHYPLFFSNGIE